MMTELSVDDIDGRTKELVELVLSSSNVVALTGAGVSTESGSDLEFGHRCLSIFVNCSSTTK